MGLGNLDGVKRRAHLLLEKFGRLLEDHLLDPHPESLTELLSVLRDDVFLSIVQSRIVRYLVKVALEFLKPLNFILFLPLANGNSRF